MLKENPTGSFGVAVSHVEVPTIRIRMLFGKLNDPIAHQIVSIHDHHESRTKLSDSHHADRQFPPFIFHTQCSFHFFRGREIHLDEFHSLIERLPESW